MTIDLLYGRATVPVVPPPGCVPTVIAKRPMPLLPDLAAAVAESMARHGDPHVAFVPEGPYVVPVAEEA